MTFDSPYALTGAYGSVSGIGTCSGIPYTAAVDEKTMFLIPVFNMAVNREREPAVLLWKYTSGILMDSPTAIQAAKWITASQGFSFITRIRASVSSTSTTLSS